MAIVGLTHDKEGKPVVRHTITTKLAIGRPPDANNKYPTRLDHIVFLQKVYQQKKMQWIIDEALMKHYGDHCTEVPIVLFADDIEDIFPSAYRAYSARGTWCKGDGETAERRPGYKKAGDPWNPFQIFEGPCANNGCPIEKAGACKPNGSLRFMLKDFPIIGSLAKINTTSKQSIAQIYSGLQSLRSVTGGRLLTVPAKLFVHPDKSMYESDGKTVSGIKHCWGLSLAAKDFQDMSGKMLEGARAFQQVRGELAGRVIEVEVDDAEEAEEIAAEFYPETIQPEPVIDIEADLIPEIEALLEAGGMNKAQRTVAINQRKGKLADYLAELKTKAAPRHANGNGNGKPAAPPPAAGRQVIADNDVNAWGF